MKLFDLLIRQFWWSRPLGMKFPYNLLIRLLYAMTVVLN